MKRIAVVLVLAIAAQAALCSFADARPGGGGGGGGGMRGGGGRPAPSRPAPSRPAPSRPSSSQGRQGFDVRSSDYKPPSNQPNRNNQQPNRNNQQPNRNNANNGNRNNNNNNGNRNNNNNNNNVNRNNNNNNVNRTVNNNNVNVNRTVINNPVYYGGGAWGWNHGVAWAPAYGYWGGGFWGAMAIGVTSAAVSAAIYGSIVANNTTYTSYEVQPSSPGATMLANYQLRQVQCGPPNLVVIYGPNNSVICAAPNNLVAAGNYDLNTQTLSLTNQ